MSEKITASLYEKAQPNTSERFGYSIETIEQVRGAVLDTLAANGVDPNTVLFSGYDKALEKQTNDEHVAEDGTPIFNLGDVRSLASPESFDGDEEEQEERWMVNPLRYALSGHSLGIYTKEALDELSGPRPDDFTDEEYGTYLYALTPQQLAAAQLIELTIRS